MPKNKRITVRLDAIAQHSEAMLHGAKVTDHTGTVIGCAGDDQAGRAPELVTAELRAVWIEEAMHALVAFRAAHGFIPRQPRFEVVTDDAGHPAPPRRWQLLPEVEAMHAAIAAASSLSV